MIFMITTCCFARIVHADNYLEVKFPERTKNIYSSGKPIEFSVLISEKIPTLFATLICEIKSADQKTVWNEQREIEMPWTEHPAYVHPGYLSFAAIRENFCLNLNRNSDYNLVIKVIGNDHLLSEIKRKIYIIAGDSSRDLKMDESFFGNCAATYDSTIDNMLGIKWLHAEIPWPWVEPERGRYCWRVVDAAIKDYADNSICIKGMLNKSAPWARKSGGGTTNVEHISPRDLKEWESYVYNVVSRYKGWIKYWDVWPEPGCGWKDSIPGYVELIKTAYQAAKKADPECKIILGNSGRIASTVGYIQSLFENGAFPYCDIVGCHPYCAPLSPEEQKWEERFAELNSLIEMYGRNKPIWVTEVGWPVGKGLEAVDEQTQANYLVRMYILGMATPNVKKMFWFLGETYGTIDSMWGIVQKNNYGYEPRPAFFAFAALTSILNKAEYKSTIYLKDIKDKYSRCYIFAKDDKKYVAVCWRLGLSTQLEVDDSGIDKVIDSYGNSLFPPKVSASNILLPISQTPIYVAFKNGVKLDAIKECFRAGKINNISDETVFERLSMNIEPVGSVCSDVKSLDIRLFNQSSETVKGSMKLQPPTDWELYQNALSFSIAPEEEKVYKFYVSKTVANPSNEYQIYSKLDTQDNVSLESRKMLDFQVCNYMLNPPKIDGDISDWEKTYPVFVDKSIFGTKNYTGPSDLSAIIRTGWDDNCFYIAAKVYDDHFVPNDDVLYAGDCVQIAFDTLRDARRAAYDANDYEYTMALTSKGEKMLCSWFGDKGGYNRLIEDGGLKLRIRVVEKLPPSPHVVYYEAAIPFLYLNPFLPKPGAKIGVSVAVLDNDGTLKGGVEYGGGIAGGKNPCMFKEWILVRE